MTASKHPSARQVVTVVDEDASVQGRLTGGEIVIWGGFKGEVAGREVRVESSARVEANVACTRAQILGRFLGKVDADAIRFGPDAVAEGIFRSSQLSVAEGAVVNGIVGPRTERPGEATAPGAPPTESAGAAGSAPPTTTAVRIP